MALVNVEKLVRQERMRALTKLGDWNVGEDATKDAAIGMTWRCEDKNFARS